MAELSVSKKNIYSYLTDSFQESKVKLFIIPEASVYHFGIMTSNVHMAWMRTVAARLKSDYTYSKDIVYNKEAADKIREANG